MTTSGGKTSPLAGIRVLDFTTMMAGPYCTRLLADLGAEVVKIEGPGGDEMRSREPLKDGCSRYFGHLNAGKRSVVLDLKDERARDAIWRLAERTDVVVEAFRPGVMRRLGLAYGKFAELNPRLVYCSISGYGQSGPEGEKPAYAPMVHASSGYDLTLQGYDPDAARPTATTVFVADAMGGLYAASAIQTALFQRERTGRGQQLDVTLMETMLNLLMYEVQVAQQPVRSLRPRYRALRTLDGFVVALPINARNFRNLCAGIGRPELAEDARFHEPATRLSNWDALMDEVERWTAVRTAAQCEELLLAADVPASRYRTVKDALADPHLALRGTFSEVSDRAGPFRVTCMPFTMSDGENRVAGPVPALGEHTAAVLRDVARLGEDEIAHLARPPAAGAGRRSA